MNLATTLNFYGGYVNQATYWQTGSVDGFGKRTFLTPVLLNVRWADRSDLVIKKANEDVISHATVFVQQDMNLGDYLAQGDFTATADPLSIPENAFMVLQVFKNTSLMGLEVFRSVNL